jgi:hypothetical protein
MRMLCAHVLANATSQHGDLDQITKRIRPTTGSAWARRAHFFALSHRSAHAFLSSRVLRRHHTKTIDI